LIEPVAVAVHFQNMDVVGKPVEQRTGEPLGNRGTAALRNVLKIANGDVHGGQKIDIGRLILRRIPASKLYDVTHGYSCRRITLIYDRH
jgi:hypothetical protein